MGGLEQQLFTMKLASKQMIRNSKKCEKEEAQQRKLVKTAIEKGNQEMARIYANNAIRKKNEGLNFLRLAARLDTVAAQIQSAIANGTMTKTLSEVVRGLEKAVEPGNVEQMSLMMDNFEEQVSMLNTQTSYMDTTMGNTAQLTTPADQVDELIQQVADQHGLEVNMQLGATSAPTSTPLTNANAVDQNEELTERLNALRNRQ